MGAILGLRDVQSLDAAARPSDYAELVCDYWKSARMMTALLTKLQGRRRVTDPEYTVFESDMPVRRAFINNAPGPYAAEATSLVIDDGNGGSGMAKYFRKGLVVVVGTDPSAGEMLQIAEDPTGDSTITVLRGQFGTSAATIANNTPLTILFDASAEGGPVPTATVDEPTARTNYIGVIQTPVDLTEMMAETKTRYGVPEDVRLRRRKLWDHSFDVEFSLLYGRKAYKTDPATGTRVRTMGGIAYWLNAAGVNVWDASSTNFTFANWYTWMGSLNYGSEQVILMAGNTLLNSIHALVRKEGVQQITPYENKWGFSLDRIKIGGKEILLAEHKLLTQLFPGDGFVVDLPCLKYCFMHDFEFRPVKTAGTVLRKQWVYLTEPGLQFTNPRAFAYIKGNTAFTAT
jgi:hypothetical protein